MYILTDEVHVDMCLEIEAVSERVKAPLGWANERRGRHGGNSIRF